MRSFLAGLLLISIQGTCFTQSLPYEDAAFLYLNFQDLQAQKDTSIRLRIYQDVRVDSLGQRFWFAERNKGLTKEPLAIRMSDKLYFREKSMRELLPPTFHPNSRKETNYYYPVIESGRYFYFEILSEDRNPDLNVAMTLMGGAVGQALSAPLAPLEIKKSAVVFDSQTQKFFAFDTWKELQAFLTAYHPGYKSSILHAGNSLDDFRQVFRELNQQ
jgi:hypothetical protein